MKTVNSRKNRKLSMMLVVVMAAAFAMLNSGCRSLKYPGFEHYHQDRHVFFQEAGNLMEMNTEITVFWDITDLSTLNNKKVGFIRVWGYPGDGEFFIGEPWEVRALMGGIPAILAHNGYQKVLPVLSDDKSEWRRRKPTPPQIEIEIRPQQEIKMPPRIRKRQKTNLLTFNPNL